MKNNLKSYTYVGIALVFLGAASAPQAATSFPTKAIRFVVGFPPGGGNDTMARLFGQKYSERFGQSVVIDNRPGAGGNLAAELVAKAAPDGHTILMVSSSHPIQGLLKSHLAYDPIRDFSSVAQLVHYRYVLVTHPSTGASSVRELIAQAKEKPGQLNFASAGIGTGGHLATELFRFVTNVNITHIPYKGTAQAVTDLLAARVQMMFTPTLAVAPHVQSKRLRALGVSSATRSRVMPDLPTLTEAGAVGYAFAAWYGILAPAHTPANALNTLHAETLRALQTQEIRDRLNAEDLDPANATPAQLDDLRRAELSKWTKIVAQLGLKF